MLGTHKAVVRAKKQAENYIHALPAAEGRPPFLIVVDVGHSIEIYSEFTCTGGIYVPWADPRIPVYRYTNPRPQSPSHRRRAGCVGAGGVSCSDTIKK